MMVLTGWISAVAAAEPCSSAEAVEAAREAVVAGELDAATSHLLRAEEALGCGEVARPGDLSRFWLVEGALLARADDPAATLSLSAARRTDPALWIAELGEDLQARWSAAAPEPGEGALALDVDGRPVAVDGAPFAGGPVPAGLHAVQVLDADGAVRYGAVVYVGDGTVTHVTTGLPPLPPPPVPEPAPAPSLAVDLTARAVTGLSLAVGRPISAPEGGRTLTEPAAKLVLPIGLAVGGRIGPAWARAEGGVGWLVGGPYLSVFADGSPHRTPVRVDVGLSGGVTADRLLPGLQLGVASGIQWPGRLYERALVALTAPEGARVPWVAEVRGGFNVATDRPVEPGVEVLFGVLLLP